MAYLGQTAGQMKIEGAAELEQFMRKLPINLRRKHMRNAVRRGVTILRNEIKKTAPVGVGAIRTYRKGEKRAKHGRLQRLIRIKPKRQKKTYTKVQLIYPTIGAGNDPKNAYYWRFLADGTQYIPAGKYDWIIRAVDVKFASVVRKVMVETRKGVEEDLAKIYTKAPR